MKRTGSTPETAATPATRAREVLATLERAGTTRYRDGMARYGLPSEHAFGVPVAAIQALGRKIGRDHELAVALWETGNYEARMLVAFIADPARLTAAEMDRWCRDFDNWGICDTLCFHLFDRSPRAWAKVQQWSGRRAEFEKRAAFALLASIAGHDKSEGDQRFLDSLELIEEASTDARNFVKKGVSWALRRIGRRNRVLHEAASALARKLATSNDAAARWIGKDASRELARADVIARLAGPKKKPAAKTRRRAAETA